MAYHYVPRGYTPAKVNHIYSRWSMRNTYSRYKLADVNEATGYCKLVSLMSGYVFYVSIAELSNWYIVGKAGE